MAEMTESEIREIVKEAVAEGVDEAFSRMGFNIEDWPNEQRDRIFLRNWRESSEAFRRHGWLTLIGLAVAAVAGWLLTGMRG